VSVVKEISAPRYPSFTGIRKANRAEIPVWSAGDLGVEADAAGARASRVDWSNIYEPPPRDTNVEILEGDTPQEKAKKLVDRLFEEKVI